MATILWLMLLVPAFFFICGAPPPHMDLGKFSLFAVLSFFLKRIIERSGKRQPRSSTPPIHPLDK